MRSTQHQRIAEVKLALTRPVFLSTRAIFETAPALAANKSIIEVFATSFVRKREMEEQFITYSRLNLWTQAVF